MSDNPVETHVPFVRLLGLKRGTRRRTQSVWSWSATIRDAYIRAYAFAFAIVMSRFPELSDRRYVMST